MPDPTLLQVKVLHLKKGSIFGKAKKTTQSQTTLPLVLFFENWAWNQFLGVNFQIKISWGLEASDPSEKQSFFEGKEVSASPGIDPTLQQVKSFASKEKVF